MILVRVYDAETGVFVGERHYQGVPREGDEIRITGEDCRVVKSVAKWWLSARNPEVTVHVSSLHSEQKEWWK